MRAGRLLRAGSGVIAALVFAVAPLLAQSATINVSGGMLRVRAPAFSFIKGESLTRLKDGRSVQMEFALTVLPRPGAAAIAEARQDFILSYDLWEERFAAAMVDPARGRAASSPAISHLSAKDAEAWCLDHLTVAVSALSSLGRDDAFWVRIAYQVRTGDPGAAADDAGFSLRGLIDRLSRRSGVDDRRDAIEAGPFRLSR
jgi:hypothetical protein